MKAKRLISIALSLLLVFSFVFPMGAFAEEFFFFEDDYPESYYEEEWLPDEVFEEQDLLEEDYSFDNDEFFFFDDSNTFSEEDFVIEEIEEYSEPDANEDVFGEDIAIEEIEEESEPDADLSEDLLVAEAEFTASDNEAFEASGSPVINAAANMEIAQVDDSVVITATVSGTAGTVAYQWQVSKDGGNTWAKTGLSGNKTAELRFEATEARLANQYRCAVTDENGTWYSNAVQVALLVEPEVTAAANMETAKTDDNVVITVTVSGTTGTVSYQWQVSKDGGNTWAKTGLSGNKTAELRFEATEARLANQYRCAVTDENGTWYSNAVQVEFENDIVLDDVLYEVLTPSTCSVSSYAGNATVLVIPETVEGMTVTEIGEEAFIGNTVLTSIDLPDTITVIHARAFKGCTSLSEMK